MYIKRIVIQGFKSYKNQTRVEPFSPKLNVIVGRNGSGKSNFFAAIRFVLGDAYSTGLSREERQGLIHEGSGSSVMSAYVELVIDNSDDRFLTGNDELVLRRTIGLKKDEYSLDRKNATRSDVMNVLEIAGFSRANPYFIVPQGRVSRITNMKDSERLDILKTVAGTQVFAVKKEESFKIMNETNNKMAAIDSTFEQISERLADLEEEQVELRNFQEQDAEKRAVEWVVSQRELEAVNAALEKIEGRRDGRVDEAADVRDKHNEAEDNMARIAQQLEQLKQNIQAARLEKRQLEEERRERAKAKAQAELEVKNMTAGQGAAQRSKHQRDQNLQQVQQDIADAEQELEDARPQFERAQQKAQSTKTRLDNAETKQKRLYEKQGRNARFRSKKERDDWLKEQIEQANTSLARYKATRMQTNEEIVEDQNTVSQLEGEVEQLKQQLSGQPSTQTLRQQLDAGKEKQSQLDDERKVLWRKDAGFDNELSNATDDL
ncbi:Structural maintenance of chromosomes protein 3, partial [Elasticomyces elasticus]